MDVLLQSLSEMLASPFMLNALLAGLLASVACGVTGVLVLQNRLAFLAGGAAHAAYGGIGLAFYFSLPVLPCTLLFSLAASLVMGRFALRGMEEGRPETQDAAIGVLWAAGMAFGIILVEMTPGYAGELMGYLFGGILTVPSADLAGMGIFDLVLLGLVFFFRQGLWALSLDREFAAARGLPVKALYLLLVAFTALTVVMLMRIVGLILVLALLTIPPTLAGSFCRSLYPAMLLSGVFAFLFCLAGLLFSWFTDLTSGASIIAVAVIAHFLVRLFRRGF
ncbi:MAG: metal ABC transporter permease [Desulfovibrio sp.]|jgi:zinc transport system permease protein|nr:metal ABC transporter permease [Desulfovibrio sp.]